MPKPLGEDELKLKQRARRRLIGAIALLAALVLILPMVLDKEPKHSSNDIAVHIPTAQQAPTNTEVAPPEPAATPESKPETSPAAAPEHGVVEQPPEAPALTPAEIPPAVAADTPTRQNHDAGYFVQVGVFSKSENAKSIQAKLSRAKLPAFSEQISTSAGARTRVRVGPFDDRSNADAALEKVKRAGEKGAVVVKANRSR